MNLTPGLPCPACGGVRSTQMVSREDIRREVELLWEYHDSRLRPAVPPRSLLDRVVFSQEPPLRLVRCDGCGTVLRDPRESSGEITAIYADEEHDPETLDSLFAVQRRGYRAQAGRLTRVLGRAGSGLEVGSYVGAFLAAAAEAGWRFEGVDVNEAATLAARDRGLAVSAGLLEDVPRGRRFDAVAIWNCFEQLPHPRATALAARERLGPGGVLAVRVPNGAFYAALRRGLHGAAGRPARAALALNNLLTFPYRHGFTPESLRRLLEETGFAVETVIGDVLVRTSDRWTRPWAAVEERAAKALLRPIARMVPAAAPWIEVYARAV